MLAALQTPLQCGSYIRAQLCPPRKTNYYNDVSAVRLESALVTAMHWPRFVFLFSCGHCVTTQCYLLELHTSAFGNEKYIWQCYLLTHELGIVTSQVDGVRDY